MMTIEEIRNGRQLKSKMVQYGTEWYNRYNILILNGLIVLSLVSNA